MKIKVGIISVGGAGRAHLVRFLKNSKAEVVMVCDPNSKIIEETRKYVATTFPDNPPDYWATTDLDEFWNHGGIDAVSVCSPDHLHRLHVCGALERGWDVLCEKPIATSSSDADVMVALAAKQDRLLMVHHQMRYLPVFQKTRELVADYSLGTVFAVEADYYHDMHKRATLYDNWRVDDEIYQEIVLGGGCHPLDLMQWVLNNHIVEVFSYANHLAFQEYPGMDTVMTLLKFSSGQIGRMTTSFGCSYPGTRHTLSVFGTEGTIVDGLLLSTHRPSKMLHLPTQYLSRPQRWLAQLLMRWGNAIHYPYNHNEHDLACEELINDFIDCVLHHTESPIPPTQSADVIRVCEAINESYRAGIPVAVQR